ncbi:MAG TPA: cupredoxin domain-containing protein [Solirubrobacteraceae bacterium]|nr:cupredoxin domain-containing protein [Solirubrobacteraceae bacterium]
MRSNKIAAGLVIALAGAGGMAASASNARPAATYSLSADKSKLKFNKTTIRARSGRVTLRLSNPSSIPHNVGIKGKGVSKTIGRNRTASYSATLRKGTYTFYCGVGQHERAGMRGKLIVT